jgi:hypothetical protein
MKFANQASWDRLLRIAVGLVMLVLGWLGIWDGILEAGLKIFGWIPLATGIIGWSPLYAILGWSTLRAGGDSAPRQKPHP